MKENFTHILSVMVIVLAFICFFLAVFQGGVIEGQGSCTAGKKQEVLTLNCRTDMYNVYILKNCLQQQREEK